MNHQKQDVKPVGGCNDLRMDTCLPINMNKEEPVSPALNHQHAHWLGGLSGYISPIEPNSVMKERSIQSSLSSLDNPEAGDELNSKLRKIREVSYENSVSRPSEIGYSAQILPSTKDIPHKPISGEHFKEDRQEPKKNLNLNDLKKRFLGKSKQAVPVWEKLTSTAIKEGIEEYFSVFT